MMKLLASAAAATLVVGPALALAQVKPDLSGRWEVSQAKSSPGAIGNNARVSFPSELVVKQNPAEVHVEMRFPRSEPVRAAYKLDGSEITIAIPGGITEKARAAWDGDRLVISSRRVISTAFGDFVTDSKETWSRTANVLRIEKTQTSEGISQTELAIFEYDQP